MEFIKKVVLILFALGLLALAAHFLFPSVEQCEIITRIEDGFLVKYCKLN